MTRFFNKNPTFQPLQLRLCQIKCLFANISEITCCDTLYLKEVKFYWKMGFKNWNTLAHITSVLQNFSYPIPTTTPLLHFQKQGDWNSTMVISILTCVCKFYQNWIQTFCALKKPDFWMIKVTLVAFYFLIVPALIFFLLKCGYFFASLLWNCFWKFAFFLSSKSLLWGKCNFRFFLIFESC